MFIVYRFHYFTIHVFCLSLTIEFRFYGYAYIWKELHSLNSAKLDLFYD